MPHQPPHSRRRAVLHRIGLTLASVALVAACTPAPTPSIGLTLDDPSPTAIRGQTIQISVDLTRLGGADAPVALGLTGLPANVTAAFAPASLAGAATESTLTLTIDASAAEGSSVLTVTGTAGTLTSETDLTLTVASLTVNGRVEGVYRRPVIGATIASQGATAFSDATGAFTLDGLSIPYDLVVSAGVGDGGLHAYEGMTSATPLLRPTFAVIGLLAVGFSATIEGSFVGGELEADEAVVVCLEGLAVATLGCDFQTGGAMGYSVNASWFDGATTGVRLHAFHLEVDADNIPTAFLGYETINLNLEDAFLTIADLDFDPVASDTLTGTSSHPVTHPDTDLLVLARFGPNLSMPLMQVTDPGAAFEYLVPVLPGLSYDVVFVAVGASSTVLTWKHDVGLASGALAVAAPTEPVSPADGAIGVDLTTPFSTTAVGGARSYVWFPDAAGPILGLTTTRTTTTLPDPALGGLAFPAAAAYGWLAIGHGDEDVDSAASGGYADYVNLLNAVFFGGGPGINGDRTFALSIIDRAFTFAP